MYSEYSEIKQNIIKNFLNKCYLYAYGYRKEPIINKIIENSIFPTVYNYQNDMMTMNLGNEIIIDFKFEWSISIFEKNKSQYYKITNIK